MTGRRLISAMLVVSLSSLLSAAQSDAQANRTWVSGVGDDLNPCSRTAPCKTFAGAISKTAAGGEISVLDPGGFGPLTITKSITIDGDTGAGLAGMLASGTNGVIVRAGANDIVILRSLSINGAGATPGMNGIRFLSGRALHVEHCQVFGFSNHGIDMEHASATMPGELTVANTTFTNIGGAAIRIATSAAGAVAPSASLDHVLINRAQIGVDVIAGTATISNAVVSHVTAQAVLAENASVVNVVSSVISSSGTGVSAAGKGSIVRLSNCDVMSNATGVNVAAGATGQRFANSRIAGNGTDVVGTLTIVPGP